MYVFLIILLNIYLFIYEYDASDSGENIFHPNKFFKLYIVIQIKIHKILKVIIIA